MKVHARQFIRRVHGTATKGDMWLDVEFSVDVAKMIDMAYSAPGMPLRPSRKEASTS